MSKDYFPFTCPKCLTVSMVIDQREYDSRLDYFRCPCGELYYHSELYSLSLKEGGNNNLNIKETLIL